MELSSADIYTDFSGFARLRAQAREGGDEARNKVAEQVEGLFMSLVLKSMREAGQAFGDTVGGMQQNMYDSQLAVDLTKGGKLGFARTMFAEPRAVASGIAPGTAFPAPTRNMSMPARDWIAVRETNAAQLAGGAPIGKTHGGSAAANSTTASALNPQSWDSPEAFARQLWPAANRAANQLGTSAEAVLAVAALETGWGKHMPSKADGGTSNNLFGIKAHGWSGDVTHSPTLEYENGAFVRRVEPFRAYASAEHAMADFANFVSSQPRYRQALQSAGDPVKFVRALHEAGYATDPRYGDKLEALVNSAVLKQAAPQKLAAAFNEHPST
ncbi:MAG: flagellar protein FlgJ [Gammaproteobacteria bacterium]